jgi:ribose transport system substrate-binding protein
MKKFIEIILILSISMICISLLSCTKKVETNNSQKEMYRVTCIIPHKDDKAYWSVIEDGLIDGAKDNNIDIKILYPSLNYDTKQMNNLLEMAIASKVDCIVISGVEDPIYYSVIQEAIDNDIFVIFVDTDMKDIDSTLYVGSDNYAAGVLYGENIARIKNNKANIGIISGDDVFFNLNKRLEGLNSIVNLYPEMNIVDIKYDKFDYDKVKQIYEGFINDSSIDTIVCLEGTGGMALNSYLETMPNVDIFVFDDTPQALIGIDKQYFKGLLVQEKYQMGYRVIQEIELYRQKGTFKPGQIYTNTVFIEAKNER